MSNKVLKTIVLFTITIGIFYFIFSKISFSKTLSIIVSSKILLILISLLLLAGNLFFIIIRWRYLMTAIGAKTTMKKATNAVMAACALNSVLPSKLGDLYKAYYFKEAGLAKVTGAVATERLFDIFALAIFMLIASIILQQQIFTYISLLLIVGLLLSIACIYLIRNMTKMKRIKNLLYAFNWITKNPIKALLIFIFSSLSWLLSVIQIYFLFLAVSIEIPFIYFSAGIILTIFISLIPITIAGMGTRETTILYLFQNYAPVEPLLAAGLLFSFFRYWFLSLLGLPFLLKK